MGITFRVVLAGNRVPICVMDHIEKDVNLYKAALQANWPSPGAGGFIEL